MIDSLVEFFRGECPIVINNSQALEKFITQYDRGDFSRYTPVPPEFREILECKRALFAYYPFHISINGRFRKHMTIVHVKKSKLYYVSGRDG